MRVDMDIDLELDREERNRLYRRSIRKDTRDEILYAILSVFFVIPFGIMVWWYLLATIIWLCTSVRIFDPVSYLAGVP